MLVLSRKARESIIINDDIIITVLSAEGSIVRLGIEAPRAIPVHRKEIWTRIKKNQIKSKNNNIDIEFFNSENQD